MPELQPISVAFLLYPNVTQLDLTGPAQVLSRLGRQTIHFVWKDLEPVPTDSGFSILPTATFDDVRSADMICVPGGLGCVDMIEDEEVLAWVRAVAADATWVTSVCTGSLILAAAGLLRNYRAATHWAWREHLALFGAEPVAERVVFDRNRVTGGGVTAGIDFALALTAAIRGEAHAKAVQLSLEYDPAPPFDAGSPEKAGEQLVSYVRERARKAAPDRAERIGAVAERMLVSSPYVPRFESPPVVDKATGQLLVTMTQPVPPDAPALALLSPLSGTGASYRIDFLPLADPGVDLVAPLRGVGKGTYLVRVEIDGLSTRPDFAGNRYSGPAVSI